ncbi:beta-ketoacyl synthase N-terminal-like domain-containing protein [Methylocucumis oryzae]|uniref:beta-ketoacyl synthase N-terminal-like domain-containing protein n=1 Tax=Methylocucumis oryzae TaxID=1632867 RepID=UPI0006980357|nr:polyketide synthase [Methylocucumis oryzae]
MALLRVTPNTQQHHEQPLPTLKPKAVPSKTFEHSPIAGSFDVAVIGLSGRYPKANTLNEFWQLLSAGVDAISEIPAERWDWRDGFGYSRWGGFIEGVDEFDPLFFQISPRDAERMDPQERLFLQIAYACIEDAGYTPLGLSEQRKVGVFVGVMNSLYAARASHWSIANRVSYALDFQGPSLAVDTACSSSLTAIHLALNSLATGESDVALAGGVNLILDSSHFQLLSDMTMISHSPYCRAFGANADGFVDGEGVGAVLLKPLAQAIADDDRIYGVIKASAVNAGGKSNGFTVPNPTAQAQLIANAISRAKIHPRAISYLEAHGTGTALGDPIEISALTKAFQQSAAGSAVETGYCALGSVKSNIGHSESAAGMAGLTKVLLQLQHQQLVPSLHSAQLNPAINFEQTPFFRAATRTSVAKTRVES